MSKVRVHELAKQLGMESKVVLAKLQEMGEFVRSASSTVEAPVVRKLIEMYPDAKPVEEKKPVKKAAAKKAAAKPKGEVSAEQAAELAAELGVDIEALKLEQAKSIANKEEAAKHEAADRAAENAANPADVMLPCIITSFVGTLAAFFIVGLRQRISFKSGLLLGVLMGVSMGVWF